MYFNGIYPDAWDFFDKTKEIYGLVKEDFLLNFEFVKNIVHHIELNFKEGALLWMFEHENSENVLKFIIDFFRHRGFKVTWTLLSEIDSRIIFEWDKERK